MDKKLLDMTYKLLSKTNVSVNYHDKTKREYVLKMYRALDEMVNEGKLYIPPDPQF